MVGRDPDLSLREFVYQPRFSFRDSSTESDIGLQSLAGGLEDGKSEVSRGPGSVVNSFIREYEALPPIPSRSPSLAPSFITPIEEGDETNLLDPVEPDFTQHLEGIALSLLVIGLMMAAFLLMIDSTILVTAVPSITSTFNSLEDVGWYGSSYLLATSALQLLFGKLYQFYNSKNIFISAFLIFVAGSLVCGAAQSSIMFILGRALAGCGGAGILNGAFVIVAAATPMESRPKLTGIILGVASAGVAIGPLLGGALTQHASWRWCFYLNGPVGAITAIILAIIRIPNAKVEKGPQASVRQQVDRLDLLGEILFSGFVVMLLMAVDWGGTTYAWSSPTIINLFWASLFALCSFLLWEQRRGSTAMLPLELFRNPIVSCATAVSVMSYGGLYAIIMYLPLWFQAVKGVSPVTSGVDYLPSVVTTVFGTVLSGILVSKIGYYTPFMIVGSALAAIAAGLMTTFKPSSPISAWTCYQLLNGIARGMMSQQPITAIQANLPAEQLSTGTALVVFAQNFGASVFISLGQTTFQNSLAPALRKYAPDVNAKQIADLGATAFRHVVPANLVGGVIEAYNKALTTTFYLAVATSCAAFFIAWGLGWTSVKKNDGGKQPNHRDQEAVISKRVPPARNVVHDSVRESMRRSIMSF